MDKKLLDFLNGATNVYSGPFTVGREKLPNGCEYIVLSTKSGKKMYDFFYNPKKKKKSPSEAKPKHGGFRPSYVMLMLSGIRELECDNKLEVMGCIVALSDNVEWNTGNLIQKRPKRFLNSKDFPKIFNCGKSKAFNLLRQMRELNIIEKTDNGYRMSEKYIRKGAGKSAENNPETKDGNI